MFSVTISEKGGQQSQYDFSKPEITIGRMKGNDIVLPKGNVSKQHTRIFLRDGGFFIVDLKSTNGTYVNGRKITSEQKITESDKIYIGDFILQLEEQQAQQSDAGPPAPPKPGAHPSSDGSTGGAGSSAGNAGGKKRNFPTVMEGARDRSDAKPSQPGLNQPSNPGSTGGQQAQRRQSQPGTPGRSTSAAGPPNRAPTGGGGTSGGDRSATPVPGGGDDLRKTFGESSPAADLDQDIEPIEDEIEPIDGDQAGATPPPPSTPSPAPNSGPSPSPQRPSSSGSDSTPTPAPSAPSGTTTGVGGRDSAPISSGAQRSQAPGAVASDQELEDDFEDAFHDAQRQAVARFFEAVPPDALPVTYPLTDDSVESELRGAAEDAVRSLDTAVDADRLVEALVNEAVALGPIEQYLDDDSIQAMYVNAFDRIVVRRDGQLRIAERAFSDPEMLELAARRLLGPQDAPPISDEVRFSDGTRVHILMPPVAVDGPALTIQKPNRYFPELEELADQGAMSPEMAEFLRRAVEAGRSMAIAGPTSSGKSTLLSALTRSVPRSSRVIALEQHSNLPLDEPNFIRLEASPASGFEMRFLMRNAVAMHPDRIVLDECRGAEAYEWVTAATSGTEGSMMALHGTSAVDALGRLESMCLLAGDDLSPRGLREQIAHSVDLVVVLNGRSDGGFRVQQIAEVQGVDLDSFRLNDIFYYRVEGTAGDFHPTGYIPMFYEELRHAGLDIDLGIFRD